ncbi:MAG: M17 family peptidase N-terminal domain-containing protein, partial [Candidatus Nanopelagicales bacterium]
MTSVKLSNADPVSLDVDALVLGITEDLALPAVVPAATRSMLHDMLETLGAKGKRGEITKVPSGGLAIAPLIVTVGLGE